MNTTYYQELSDTLKAANTLLEQEQLTQTNSSQSAKTSLYYAHGATDKARTELAKEQTKAGVVQGQYQATVQDKQNSDNLVTASKQAVTDATATKQKVSKTAVAIQNAATALSQLSGNVAAMMAIATAADNGSQMYEKVKKTSELAQKTANTAEKTSLVSLGTTVEASQSMASNVAGDAATLNTNLKTLESTLNGQLVAINSKVTADTQEVAAAMDTENADAGVYETSFREKLALDASEAYINKVTNYDLQTSDPGGEKPVLQRILAQLKLLKTEEQAISNLLGSSAFKNDADLQGKIKQFTEDCKEVREETEIQADAARKAPPEVFYSLESNLHRVQDLQHLIEDVVVEVTYLKQRSTKKEQEEITKIELAVKTTLKTLNDLIALLIVLTYSPATLRLPKMGRTMEVSFDAYPDQCALDKYMVIFVEQQDVSGFNWETANTLVSGQYKEVQIPVNKDGEKKKPLPAAYKALYLTQEALGDINSYYQGDGLATGIMNWISAKGKDDKNSPPVGYPTHQALKADLQAQLDLIVTPQFEYWLDGQFPESGELESPPVLKPEPGTAEYKLYHRQWMAETGNTIQDQTIQFWCLEQLGLVYLTEKMYDKKTYPELLGEFRWIRPNTDTLKGYISAQWNLAKREMSPPENEADEDNERAMWLQTNSATCFQDWYGGILVTDGEAAQDAPEGESPYDYHETLQVDQVFADFDPSVNAAVNQSVGISPPPPIGEGLPYSVLSQTFGTTQVAAFQEAWRTVWGMDTATAMVDIKSKPVKRGEAYQVYIMGVDDSTQICNPDSEAGLLSQPSEPLTLTQLLYTVTPTNSITMKPEQALPTCLCPGTPLPVDYDLPAGYELKPRTVDGDESYIPLADRFFLYMYETTEEELVANTLMLIPQSAIYRESRHGYTANDDVQLSEYRTFLMNDEDVHAYLSSVIAEEENAELYQLSFEYQIAEAQYNQASNALDKYMANNPTATQQDKGLIELTIAKQLSETKYENARESYDQALAEAQKSNRSRHSHFTFDESILKGIPASNYVTAKVATTSTDAPETLEKLQEIIGKEQQVISDLQKAKANLQDAQGDLEDAQTDLSDFIENELNTLEEQIIEGQEYLTSLLQELQALIDNDPAIQTAPDAIRYGNQLNNLTKTQYALIDQITEEYTRLMSEQLIELPHEEGGLVERTTAVKNAQYAVDIATVEYEYACDQYNYTLDEFVGLYISLNISIIAQLAMNRYVLYEATIPGSTAVDNYGESLLENQEGWYRALELTEIKGSYPELYAQYQGNYSGFTAASQIRNFPKAQDLTSDDLDQITGMVGPINQEEEELEHPDSPPQQ